MTYSQEQMKKIADALRMYGGTYVGDKKIKPKDFANYISYVQENGYDKGKFDALTTGWTKTVQIKEEDVIDGYINVTINLFDKLYNTLYISFSFGTITIKLALTEEDNKIYFGVPLLRPGRADGNYLAYDGYSYNYFNANEFFDLDNYIRNEMVGSHCILRGIQISFSPTDHTLKIQFENEKNNMYS